MTKNNQFVICKKKSKCKQNVKEIRDINLSSKSAAVFSTLEILN